MIGNIGVAHGGPISPIFGRRGWHVRAELQPEDESERYPAWDSLDLTRPLRQARDARVSLWTPCAAFYRPDSSSTVPGTFASFVHSARPFPSDPADCALMESVPGLFTHG